jgi:uncharacterized LabA/DUF88 family protein
LSEERLKIAVFIDFDNIEIGVKTTLSRRFDLGAVLEAIKERGEVVTKIAYGNWKRAEDYSRVLTEHAVQMVQRNVTPGGDKNGADINLALDALEMAFTHNHINTFVIVGGDSDFIALVEKLKQYDKKVFVVGGRAFTSVILQKNCHEFLAYENLIGLQAPSRKSAGRAPVAVRAQLADALGPLRRALKILADREVSPQLGLLKSTLLQLDPTFSERDYGAGTFREFMQKMSSAGLVNLKYVDRSLIVELRESEPAPAEPAVPAVENESVASASAPESAASLQATRELRDLLQRSRVKPRWPMYLRSFKQYLKSIDPVFEERRLGFSTIHDLLRHAQRENLLRVDRNRQGILRIFPGDRFPEGTVQLAAHAAETAGPESIETVAAPAVETEAASVVPATPDVEGEPVHEAEPAEFPVFPGEAAAGAAPEEVKPRRRRTVVSAIKARISRAGRPRSRKKATDQSPDEF